MRGKVTSNGIAVNSDCVCDIANGTCVNTGSHGCYLNIVPVPHHSNREHCNAFIDVSHI